MVVVDGTGQLLVAHATGPAPAVTPTGALVDFDTRELSAVGQARLRGTPGESAAGWALGFVQLQLVEANHATYRGATPADGSVRVQRDRPPARAQQLCRDTLSTSVPPALWYNPPAGTPGHDAAVPMTVVPAGTVIPPGGTLALAATLFDRPAERYPVVQPNTSFAPPRPNRIHSAYVAFAFCTVLTARAPAGTLHFLKHVYWNCRWDVRFSPAGAGVAVASADTAFNVQSAIHSGVPTDPRFGETHLRNAALPVCNAVAAAATPGNVVPRPGWS